MQTSLLLVPDGTRRIAALRARDVLCRGSGLLPRRRPEEGLIHGQTWREHQAAYDLVCGVFVAGQTEVIIVS